MNEYADNKKELLAAIENLLQLQESALPKSAMCQPLQQLRDDILQDYYTVVVVGEFKHGKSTFVNALLGRDIMPRNVTPTTATINAVFYKETEEMQVIQTDGTVEKQELSREALEKYTAEADFDPNAIQYIKVLMNHPLLQNRVVLVDTPGVNDLNQHRASITHQYIPRADVVLFLTSITDAIKKTEQQFIEQHLLENYLDKTIFIGNFLDRLDDDEIDDICDFVENRLKAVTNRNEVTLLPLSAKEALEARLTEDEELLELSGIQEIEEEILQRIHSSTRNEEKIDRFKIRLASIAESILQEIDTAETLSDNSLEELQQQLQAVVAWFQNQKSWEDELVSYLHEREEEVSYMVRKSVRHFGDRLNTDVENRIALYHGPDIKALVETQLPIAIRSQFMQWIDQYEDSINSLFHKLSRSVEKGLADAFSENVKLHAQHEGGLRFDVDAPMIQASSGNAHVKAGLLMGGASSIALLMGAGFFLPLVGMAGLPFLSQKIAEKQMETIKPELMAAVREQVDVLIDDFQSYLNRYIRKNIESIRENSLMEFDRIIQSYEQLLQNEIRNKEKEAADIAAHQQLLTDLREICLELVDREEAVGSERFEELTVSE
ncbi:hypothetical protein EJF36_18905 [Bacillus sp. HMF5848]|uniref:dynamin family protein n=1 Tax=Bacillus sp. HMF5848 TaxID=2495421 RepID=UPI000F781C22|nr:dynamin family protein [Bacillus sp. HMF5848]RSK28777.1 hypothetical protein EJF36_18905 [Bacillus sp. HMF5848]